MKLKIGIIGTRGIPNAYGGFEQFAETLAAALVGKGHEVSVYNSSLHPFKEMHWRGVNIIVCKDREDKYGTAGQFIYDLNCIKDSQKRNFDVLLHLGYTSDSIWHSRWPKNCLNIVNMDGLEWKRQKYSWLTKVFLRKAESWAANYADVLIADSKPIQDYLQQKYNKQSTYIPYPAEIFKNPDEPVLKKFSLQPYQYYLIVARMEPENNIEVIIRAVLASGQELVYIIGETKNKYGRYLKKKYSGNQVVFIGGIYDKQTLNNLRFYSKIYFHGHSVGGTNPSLLEAMACGCRIVAHDNIFNREVLGTDADYFSNSEDLKEIISSEKNKTDLDRQVKNNLSKIETFYSPEQIIDGYEKLLVSSLNRR